MPAPLDLLTWIWMGVAVLAGLLLLRTTAPYGRHARPGWGPTVPHRVGWIAMELVSPVALILAIRWTGRPLDTPSLILVGIWLAHYAHRAIVYPMRARWKNRRMPLAVMGSAIVFNLVNGTLNGVALSWVTPTWPAVAVGLVIWAVGWGINLHSDEILLRLRSTGSRDYGVPQGGLFRWISCPNYLGEMIEWLGFAVAASNPAAWSFFIWTVANLLPRALSHHRWYRDRFPDYPPTRRALIPWLL